MTAVATARTALLDAPVELTNRPLQHGAVLVAHWLDAGGRERERVLDTTLTAAGLEELLNFCYEAGFRDASNPRLYCP